MYIRALFPGILLLTLASMNASPPAWWGARGATDANPPNDHAVANQGQLKHFTRKAADELNSRVPGGAGPVLNNLVDQWLAAHPDPDDFHAMTAGQLKWIASTIHGRLVYIRYENAFPGWLPSTPPVTPDPADKELVNLGQLKTVFNFNLSAPVGQLPEWWEKFYSGADEDYDGDGWTNAYEAQIGTNPLLADTDGDGIPDKDDPDPLVAQASVGESPAFWVLTPLE